ncbi:MULTISPECIES: DUF975 family protein [unclassified Exiguobacterium]|uniref:DUF975 family protein n=1 Tax=unclassified Exiguobacterium TaxID=2644629 RepID=UPI00135AA0CE|nr:MULTISPECIES: DUF975 family protein [unclassified Exiguobacterium]
MRMEWKRQARHALKGNWWRMAGVALLFFIVSGIPQWFMPGVDADSPELFTSRALTWVFVSHVVQIMIAPLAIGWSWLTLDVSREKGASLWTMFRPFRTRYLKHVVTSLVMSVFLVLWSLLLIVPGVIKGFSYSLTPYILRDRPELSVLESITESRRLMDGHKMEALMLVLSFLGWFLVGTLTLGIGFFFIGPYISTTYATFYDAIRDNGEAGTDEPTHGTEQGF